MQSWVLARSCRLKYRHFNFKEINPFDNVSFKSHLGDWFQRLPNAQAGSIATHKKGICKRKNHLQTSLLLISSGESLVGCWFALWILHFIIFQDRDLRGGTTYNIEESCIDGNRALLLLLQQLHCMMFWTSRRSTWILLLGSPIKA